jgi:uncharacterized membrane protein YccC
MIIAYGIALSMDWDRPYWAGFAVAVCSLGSIGQSLNQAAMRMLGTVVAVFVALALVALFPQQRWGFMLLLSAWIGFCAYKMGGSKRAYFWFVAGFVSLVVCFTGGANSVNSFEIAVLRLQETGLGILAYSLVTSLLWPINSYADFNAALRQLVSTRLQLYRAYLEHMRDPGSDEDTQELRAQGIQLQTRVDQLLEAAITDTYEVWEVRHQWRGFRRQAAALSETMERWRHTFSEVRMLDLQRLMPDLSAFGDELDSRFVEIERMLYGHAPEQHPMLVGLTFDEAALRALPHFHKAALVVTRIRLQRLEMLSRSLFESVKDIKGFGPPKPNPVEDVPIRRGFTIDRDCAAAAARVMAGLWLAFILWIYVRVPGGDSFMVVVGVFGLAMSPLAHVPVSVLFAPLAVSVSFASIVYIFLLPQLSGFHEVAVVIFAVTFAICYIFYTPRQALSRSIGLAMFVLIAGIDNHQSYSFLHVANTVFMLALGVMLLWAIAVVTTSPRPETAFLRLLDRFLTSCEYLVSTRWAPGQPVTRLEHRRRSFHANEIATLPAKLNLWSPGIDKTLPGASPQELQAVVISLEALAHRTQELFAARDLPQADLLVQELFADISEWRSKLQEVLLADVDGTAEVLQDRLVTRLGHLETRIEETVNKATSGEISGRDSENLYRLLAAYRGVSEAVVAYARAVSGIDWARWREPRF